MARKITRSGKGIVGRKNLDGDSVYSGSHFFESIRSLNLSIRAKILLSLTVVILIMGITNALLVAQALNYSRQYDGIIRNITTANSISGIIKPEIDTEIWKFVAGKGTFVEGRQYQIIADINAKLEWMTANTDHQKSKLKLEIIRRSMQTLEENVDKMGEQIATRSTSAENEALLEDIRFITSVIEDVVQEYLIFEVQRTEQQYEVMRLSFIRWEIFSILLMIVTVAFSVAAAISLSRSIYSPIKKLHNVTTTITKNDLHALVTSENADEITELGISFNIMIGKIRELLDSKIKEQENLKKAELRALQAQINPHFLYNTLDTIIWMATSQKTDQVIEIVSALSNFFRISLSKGRDWITIGEEMDRARSYLTIQRMRYRDIMDFQIDVEEGVEEFTILKLILQPLVENAIYHGIKNKREGGMIMVRASKKNDAEILLEVEDNGIGFTAEKMKALQAELDDDSDEIKMETGFGVGNVNKRIKLYYGKQYGLTISSEYKRGTTVRLVIPATQELFQETTEPDKPSVTEQAHAPVQESPV